MVKIKKPHETLIFEDSEYLEQLLKSEGYQFQVRHNLLTPHTDKLIAQTMKENNYKFAVLDNNFNLVTATKYDIDFKHPLKGRIYDRHHIDTWLKLISERLHFVEGYFDSLNKNYPDTFYMRQYNQYGKNKRIEYRTRPDNEFKYIVKVLRRTRVTPTSWGHTSYYDDLQDIYFTNECPYQSIPLLSAFLVELLDDGNFRLVKHVGGKMEIKDKTFDWINGPETLKIDWSGFHYDTDVSKQAVTPKLLENRKKPRPNFIEWLLNWD